MKTLIYQLLISSLLVIGGCNQGGQSGSTETSSSLPDNTPKGQASVVDDVSAKNILQVAMGSDAHTTLVAAVEAAQIEHVLVNAGPLTVFAPTNDAFAALPEGTVENLLLPENKGDLATILTRHAAPGSYNVEDLLKNMEKGRKLYMATGDYLEITQEGEDVYVGGAKIVGTIETSNGIINVVDQVILPK